MNTRGRPLLLAVSVLAAACGGPVADKPATQPRLLQVGPEPLAVIGGSDDRPDYQFFNVAGATRLSDGRLAVANAGTSELRYYSADGVHLLTAGGPGGGPGEMSGIMEIVALPGDSILVLSFRPGLTWFDPDGKYVRSERLAFWSWPGVTCRTGEGNWHPLADGSVLLILEDNFGGVGCPEVPEGVWRQSALVARADNSRDRFDTLAIMLGAERDGYSYRVFGRSLLTASSEAGVFLADANADEILKLGFGGDTLAIWAMPYDGMKVPRLRSSSVEDGRTSRPTSYDYPSRYPRAGRLIASRTGELWVMGYPPLSDPIWSVRLVSASSYVLDPDGSRWRVIGSAGDLIAEVRTPPGLFVLEVGFDYVLGLEKDEADVETIVLLPLR